MSRIAAGRTVCIHMFQAPSTADLEKSLVVFGSHKPSTTESEEYVGAMSGRLGGRSPNIRAVYTDDL